MATAAHDTKAKSELFSARRTLSHLVELYNGGQWSRFYKEDTFAEMVRQARQAVEHWTAEVDNRARRGVS